MDPSDDRLSPDPDWSVPDEKPRDILVDARRQFEIEHVKFPDELADPKYRPHLGAALRNRQLDLEDWLQWINARIERIGRIEREIPAGYDDPPSKTRTRERKSRVRKSRAKVRQVKEQRSDREGVDGYPVVLLPDPNQDHWLAYYCECHRRLWNELLERNFARYAQSKQFIPLSDMSLAITRMRQDPGKFRFVAELPRDACSDLAAELDKALSSKPMPTFRKRGARGYFYVQDVKVDDGEMKLSGLDRIKVRVRKLPQGRILGVYIQRDGSGWRALLRIQSEALELK